jgi:hypothetical protein
MIEAPDVNFFDKVASVLFAALFRVLSPETKSTVTPAVLRFPSTATVAVVVPGTEVVVAPGSVVVVVVVTTTPVLLA